MAGLIFLSESFLIAFKEGFWSLQFKTILCAVGLLPPLVAAVCFWLFDYRVLHPRRRLTFRAAQVLTILLLLSPILWVATRNAYLSQSEIRDLNRWWLGLLVPVIVGWMWSSWTKQTQKTDGFQAYINGIFWDTLAMGDQSESFLDYESVRSDREGLYTDSESISTFQNSFLGRSSEAKSLAKAITDKSRRRPEQRLRILDIGCSSGGFASALLTQLTEAVGAQVELIVGIDAADFEDEYKDATTRALKGVGDDSSVSNRVKFKRCRWQAAVLDESYKFNLVICSHSLYETLDKVSSNMTSPLDTLASIIDASVDPSHHLLYISLASRASPSYEFKSRYLRECYGIPPSDACFENLVDMLPTGSFRYHYRQVFSGSLDTFLLLPTTNAERLAFGRYFLRSRLVEKEAIRYEALLNDFSHRFEHLPQCLKSDVRAQAADSEVDITLDSQVLLHKTRYSLFSSITPQELGVQL